MALLFSIALVSQEGHIGVTFILIMAIFIRITNIYIEYVLCARYSSKYFTCFIYLILIMI